MVPVEGGRGGISRIEGVTALISRFVNGVDNRASTLHDEREQARPRQLLYLLAAAQLDRASPREVHHRLEWRRDLAGREYIGDDSLVPVGSGVTDLLHLPPLGAVVHRFHPRIELGLVVSVEALEGLEDVGGDRHLFRVIPLRR